MRTDLAAAIRDNQGLFGLTLLDEQVGRLADYYELVMADNPRLHLVAPCAPAEFATRHILESLTLLAYVPLRAAFADVGAGAGLPSVPCLIVRDDLRATLIESKAKKTDFLSRTVVSLGISDRVIVVNNQFEEAESGQFSFVTCRALDGFTKKLPRLLKWSGRRDLLLFGGPTLRTELNRLDVKYAEKLMPLSDQRYLFACPPPR